VQIDFPYRVDGRGRTGAADDVEHVRDLIEQVLFTSPGERVNRPTFGSGLMQLVFAPNSDELATATQFLVQGALQQWLGEVIDIGGVEVLPHDSILEVIVQYRVKPSGQPQTASFTRAV
jgi:uncharacterized protein